MFLAPSAGKQTGEGDNNEATRVLKEQRKCSNMHIRKRKKTMCMNNHIENDKVCFTGKKSYLVSVFINCMSCFKGPVEIPIVFKYIVELKIIGHT